MNAIYIYWHSNICMLNYLSIKSLVFDALVTHLNDCLIMVLLDLHLFSSCLIVQNINHIILYISHISPPNASSSLIFSNSLIHPWSLLKYVQPFDIKVMTVMGTKLMTLYPAVDCRSLCLLFISSGIKSSLFAVNVCFINPVNTFLFL